MSPIAILGAYYVLNSSARHSESQAQIAELKAVKDELVWLRTGKRPESAFITELRERSKQRPSRKPRKATPLSFFDRVGAWVCAILLLILAGVIVHGLATL